MTRPTLEECVAVAVSLGMPPEEGERFWHYHEQSGWTIRKAPMKKWRSAIALWKLNWAKWNNPREASRLNSPMQLLLWKTELDRVEQAIKNIRGSYSENMDFTREDIDKLNGLRDRRRELLNHLGMKI